MQDLNKMLADHSKSVEKLLETVVPKDQDDFLSDGVWYQFDSGGKRLRPALCLMTCQVLGGKPEEALPFALASEILHNVLLIHDDIEDGDTMRRDRPTLWVEYGVPNAINVSDYLIAKAYRLILEAALPDAINLRLARAYSFAFQKTVEGQALDINLRGRADVTLETYYRIVTHKTGYYLALPWVGGATVAGVPEDDMELFWELGKCIGPAFQIRDDVIDLTHGKGRGGEIGCDIREGKPSILFAYCLDKKVGSDDDRGKLVDIVGRSRDDTSEEDIKWVIEFFRSSGALDFAQSEADRLVSAANELLDRLPLNDEGKENFRAVARYVIDRKM